ncbi:MAG: xanthine dehydrogenase family protein molybdopterin-binding subunit, partial [Candidatus Rokubacteria bacterium]|nr:xanthine dehydrogenase family protein molybdopterin-binding subunit [Candidatus Rokubacteria bacterium]
MTDAAALWQTLRLIGRPVARHDALDKVAAATAYAADWSMPGMLHGAVLRSPYPSARIRRLDLARARAIPGVAAVLTAKDVPRNALWTDVPGQTTPVGPLRARLYVLAEERVRYQGEPVALVAAESEELARLALEAIEVEYEPLPGVFDPARALEPESGVAWIDSDGVITIRVSTQVIEHFRDVAEVLQVPQNRVRVIAPYLGGGFGGKEDVTVEVYLGLLAWRTGRPVKMV